jgi:hypothetical protein
MTPDLTFDRFGRKTHFTDLRESIELLFRLKTHFRQKSYRELHNTVGKPDATWHFKPGRVRRSARRTEQAFSPSLAAPKSCRQPQNEEHFGSRCTKTAETAPDTRQVKICIYL